MLDTILFDLDGTLLPMEQNDFIRAYVTQLCRRYVPCGYDKDLIVKALWAGTAAMVQNDGACTNEERFWQSFAALLGDTTPIRDSIPSFYTAEFDEIRAVTTPTPLSRQIVATLQHKGYTLVLATNPIFPAVAVETRLSWVGLRGSDFDYVTTYENSRHSKPDPGYYRDILAHIGRQGAECLMVGNNPGDDMSALQVGLEGYLVTDCLENPDGLAVDSFRSGSFQEAEKFLLSLPQVK